MANNERRYNDKEVGKILRHAAQRQAGGSGDHPDGMTLAELQRVAAEVNIDPANILAAAEHLEAGDSSEDRVLGNTMLHKEEIIEGEVDDAAWEGIVSQLRATFGVPGEATKLGAAYEWTARFDAGSTVHLSASPRNGRTVIRLMAEYGQVMFLTWMISGVATLIASALIGKLMAKAGIPSGSIVMVVLLAIFAIASISFLCLRTWQQSNRRKLNGLMKRITTTAAQPVPFGPMSSTSQEDASEIQVQA